MPDFGPYPAILKRIPVRFLMDILNAVGDVETLLESSLRLALHTFSAERGVAFDNAGNLVFAGYRGKWARICRKRLSRLTADEQVCHYRAPKFADLSENGDCAAGIAGVIETRYRVFVLGIERTEPFNSSEMQDLAEILSLLRNPLDQTAQILRRDQTWKHNRRRLWPEELPLRRLRALPQLRELEKMLIQEALKRSRTVSEAARHIGVTREALKKKAVRFHLLPETES